MACDCGQYHSGLPERAGRAYERGFSPNGRCIQSVGTGDDKSKSAVWHGECQSQEAADWAAAGDRR